MDTSRDNTKISHNPPAAGTGKSWRGELQKDDSVAKPSQILPQVVTFPLCKTVLRHVNYEKLLRLNQNHYKLFRNTENHYGYRENQKYCTNTY